MAEDDVKPQEQNKQQRLEAEGWQAIRFFGRNGIIMAKGEERKVIVGNSYEFEYPAKNV